VLAAEVSTARIPSYAYEPAPQGSQPSNLGVPPSAASHPQGLGALPRASPARKAWKKTGPTIGRASGLLLLALAGLAILGALFVVFSLLE